MMLTCQLFPILISLEAGADRQIAEQALALHTTLHTKHPSLLNVRYLEFARSSYDYLRTITAEPVGHYNGTPGLGGWYDLLSEKRAWRLEFLRALVKAFDFELMGNEKASCDSCRVITDPRSNRASFCTSQRTFPLSTTSCKRRSCVLYSTSAMLYRKVPRSRMPSS